jgi:hypothetical protein
MKKALLGLVAFACLVGMGLLATRKAKKMHEQCGQMIEHCKQMVAQHEDREPAEERDPAVVAA